MIYVALGANLPSQYGSPADTLKAAVKAISAHGGIKVIDTARIWLSAPVPFDPDQAWYHNSVIAVETDLSPHELLTVLLNIEAEFGRVRGLKNAPRVLDLDIVAYDNEIVQDKGGDANGLILPHPRMHERLFVLMPLQDIDQNWTHPESGHSVAELIATCDESQQLKTLGDDKL